jgi:hypothetical protein
MRYVKTDGRGRCEDRIPRNVALLVRFHASSRQVMFSNPTRPVLALQNFCPQNLLWRDAQGSGPAALCSKNERPEPRGKWRDRLIDIRHWKRNWGLRCSFTSGDMPLHWGDFRMSPSDAIAFRSTLGFCLHAWLDKERHPPVGAMQTGFQQARSSRRRSLRS